jgi:hypothetical protein
MDLVGGIINKTVLYVVLNVVAAINEELSIRICRHGRTAFLVCFAFYSLDDWLTVHRSITLVDLQLDAQNSYLFTYNIFIKILYMFRALPCSSSGGLRRNYIYVASGIVTLCR